MSSASSPPGPRPGDSSDGDFGDRGAVRASFGSRVGLLFTMIGVAVGLGNVWRFPYMVGKFGGAAFVLFYVLMALAVGLPALMAEWTLGRHSRRGPVGAFEKGGLPGGRFAGWGLFAVVIAATAYYTNAVGWVLYSAAGQVARLVGFPWAEGAVLPPAEGFDGRALGLQMLCTGLVILAAVWVLLRGLKAGTEAASRVLVPLLFGSLLLLIARSLTLPGAWAGVEWYILKFEPSSLTPSVMVAALGQAIFSLSLGGTFMVVYGSYLRGRESLAGNAAWTAAGDLGAGLLAGLAILPAVVALGLEPARGPGLLFETLPGVFARIPLGDLFGLVFYLGLLGAAYLSDVAAFEVLVAGVTDNMGISRPKAVWLLAGAVFILAIPPMVNMEIFLPWDLAFGSGMQTLGALLAVVTVGWCMNRSAALAQLGGPQGPAAARWLIVWLRFGVPGAILLVGVWWLLSDVLGVVAS